MTLQPRALFFAHRQYIWHTCELLHVIYTGCDLAGPEMACKPPIVIAGRINNAVDGRDDKTTQLYKTFT